MKPFNSSKFFSDPFFADPTPIIINGQSVQGVVTEKALLSSDGGISGRTGHWIDVALMKGSTLPAVHTDITVRGTVYRVEVIQPEGDVVILACLEQQRRK